jgi:proteasome lid subunit RPN8/RPN11
VYGRRRSEALMFWGGVVSGSSLQITGVFLPRHRAGGAHVKLSNEESRWLIRRLRARDEKLIAQVHSHPGKAFHSEGDDEGATSFHAGFLSVVVPEYGRRATSISDCAVYEHDGNSFIELTPKQIMERFRVQPLVDRRT